MHCWRLAPFWTSTCLRRRTWGRHFFHRNRGSRFGCGQPGPCPERHRLTQRPPLQRHHPWRRNWWHAIWANSQDNYTNLLIGPGYGFSLRKPGELPQSRSATCEHRTISFTMLSATAAGSAYSSSSPCKARVGSCCGERTGSPAKPGVRYLGIRSDVRVLRQRAGDACGAIPFYLTMGLFVGPALAALGSPVREALSHPAAPSVYPSADADMRRKAPTHRKPFDGCGHRSCPDWRWLCTSQWCG